LRFLARGVDTWHVTSTKEVNADINVNKKTNATLEAGLSIDVTCATCYIKGAATAELIINGKFDLGGTLSNVTKQLGTELKNLTETTVDSLGDIAKNFLQEIKDAAVKQTAFEIEDVLNFDNLHIDTDIDIDLPPLPEVQLLMQIDHLDLYMAIDTTISAHATLTIPLYKSQSVVGISSGDDLEIGLLATMDLILSAEGEITLRSGFHLLLEKPIGFSLALFSNNVSDIIL
jgi:hypothetical protein